MSGAPKKPRVAFYWCSSCGGCDEAVVDLAEGILEVVEAVDIVLWPVAMDFKRSDVEAMAEGEILATFINGAIRTTEQEEMARLLRSRSRLLIAFGSCAHTGGIPGLANLWDRETIFDTVYRSCPSTVNPEGVLPRMTTTENGNTVSLPGFFDTVRALDQVTEVDYYLPGCAPTPKSIMGAVDALLGGELPPRGTVLLPDRALCTECPRKETKPESLSVSGFKRPHELILKEDECLLAQGVLCMGPATRAGCEALCVKGNMPCTGCCGPTSRVRDQGGKALSAFASILDCTEPDALLQAVESVPDLVGTLYRYGLPSSLLVRRRKEAVPRPLSQAG